jgi:hypothetical protein
MNTYFGKINKEINVQPRKIITIVGGRLITAFMIDIMGKKISSNRKRHLLEDIVIL